MPINEDGHALLRVARELREFLQTATEEPEARSLLDDVETVERVGRWLASTTPIGGESKEEKVK